MKKNIFLILGLGALFYFYQFFLRNSPSVLGEHIVNDFGASATMLGVFSSSYYVPYVLGQVPIGVMFDTFGPRKVMFIGALLCALGVLLLSVSPCFEVTVIARFIMGAGAGASFTGPIKLSAAWVTPTHLALSLGILSALGKMGGAISSVVLPSCIRHSGSWRGTFFTVGCVGIPIALLIYKFVRNSPLDDGKKSRSKKIDFGTVMLNLKTVAKSKTVWLVGIYSYCMHLPISAFSDTWSSVFIKSFYGISLQQAASIKSFILVGSCVGSPLFSYISDKMQSRIPCLKAAFLSCIISMAWIIFFPPKSLIMASVVLFIIGVASAGQVLVYAIAAESAHPIFSGAATSIVNMLTMAGGMMHAPLIGFLIDISSSGKVASINDYRFALSSIIVAIAVSGAITYILPETFPKKAAL